MSQKKIRVAVLYGGRSGEHEVSLRSAASVIRELDRTRFEIVPIGIDKEGRWHVTTPQALAMQSGAQVLPVFKDEPDVILPANPTASNTGVLSTASGGASTAFDVVFPVMHGTFCEDGTIQGLLELADVPYVGCGVLSSAVGMDKDFAKRIARDAGLPIVPYVVLKSGEWQRDAAAWTARIEREIGIPCFVKPSNAGSSVGVHKVKDRAQLATAIADAFLYDVKILVEQAIAAREIEFSVLENPKYGEPPLVSVAGEITPTHEFYSYEAKYLDENGAALSIPAKLDGERMKRAQEIAVGAFVALECEGMARVDLFLDKNTGEFYFNEVNTLPGFTSISMYPKMWEASGIGYSELLTRLVELAIARHARKRALKRDFLPG